MAIGDSLVENVPAAAPAPVPPMMDPAQLAQVLQGYRNAFAGMTGDQTREEALTRLGLGLLQPVQPGQTAGSVLSKAGTDALDYYAAKSAQERNQLFQGLDVASKLQQNAANVQNVAERTAASQQSRGIEAAMAPAQLGQAQLQYRQAQKALELINAEEAAGTRSPDFLKRKANAETAVREALTKVYEAHAKMYEAAANAQPNKNQKQTLNVQKIENPDGTMSIVSTVVVNGQPYFHTYTPPRFPDVKSATDFATKEVDKETPSSWNIFAGQAPYAPATREAEIARRAKEYMTPRLTILGPQGQVDPRQWETIGGASPAVAAAAQPPQQPPSPANFPKETPAQASAANERSLGLIRGELRDARQKGDQELVASLEKEEQNAMARMKGGATAQPAGQPSNVVEFARDARGNIVPKQQAIQNVPATPMPSPEQAAREALTAAQSDTRRAIARLKDFPPQRQRIDQRGYLEALMNVKKAQETEAAAQADYERLQAPNVRPGTGPRNPAERLPQ